VVYSSTDLDAQVFVIGGSDEPLIRVTTLGPGDVKLRWKVKDGASLDYADFQFESPEPSLPALKVAYPPGTHHFPGNTSEGNVLLGDVI